ncbi:DUF1905 domain-containing protein [Arthrobacter sp. M4]|uniref:DUF1905 domain-containing protein n=1 Tax=Arthrobacter sp. M4 TaxID=218160 RepID=UPI001CDCC091|nr:DUF1905 domain-containing protein [Arthrobacter sp. M4]MCA4131513.1 DUF1905 domain-containing protein [Arthrobacter sp. M4]
MVRFSAEVRRQGQNPYVDVPTAVSEAFRGFAVAGRIRVAGQLGEHGFNATLMPVKNGGHIMHLPGGLRSAAAVEIGDTVGIDLQPLNAGEVQEPGDLTAALGSIAGSGERWLALPSAERRELIRYLEDSRSTSTRMRRIKAIVHQVLGGQVPVPGRRIERDLWTCPDCGRQFVTRNMYHSCARHSLDGPFSGKPAAVSNLFQRVRTAVESFGPVTLVPYRDKVAFMVRVRFAGARPMQQWLDVEFWLTRRIESPRFRRVETLSPYTHLYTVRIVSPSEVNDELVAWLHEAYAVGRQEHLRSPNGH